MSCDARVGHRRLIPNPIRIYRDEALDHRLGVADDFPGFVEPGLAVEVLRQGVVSAAVRAVLPPRLELVFDGVRIGMVHAPGGTSGRLSR